MKADMFKIIHFQMFFESMTIGSGLGKKPRTESQGKGEVVNN